MPNNEADAIVQKVQNQLETHGRGAEAHAYVTLLNEMDQYKQTHSQCQTEALTNKLEQSGVLPRVAVGWLQQDFDKINTNRDDFGITRGEIAQYTHGDGSTKSDLDAILANKLLGPGPKGADQFDDVANRNWLGADPDSIERMDLNAYDRQSNRHRKHEERHEGVRDVAAPLFEGSPPLMAVLDAQSNGVCDGRVSEKDMRRFLAQCEMNNHTDNAGNSPYTPENAQYVSDLLNGAYPELTGPNDTGFSARALARRAGMDRVVINSIDDYDQLSAIYAQKTGKEIGQSQAQSAEAQVVTQTPGDAMQQDPCDVAQQKPADVVKQKDPCEVEKTDPCDVKGAVKDDSVKLDIDIFSQIDGMSHYRKGEGQWHVAKRLLNAGNSEADAAASNRDIWKLTNDIMHVDGTRALDARGRSHPIVHPGDVAPVLGNIDKLFANNPKLAESIFKMERKNIAQKQAAAAADATVDECGDN
ncbi:MAG TPA: hypothetical protein V6C76_07010 [Drouetiella sp.]